MALEHARGKLAAEIDWPETPLLRPELGPRRVDLRGRVLLALALALVALGSAFAVPQSRGAILRFFGLGAARIEFVGRLPAARERPLSAGLGPVVSEASARELLRQAAVLPPLSPPPPLHGEDRVVSLLFLHDGEPVLLSEIDGGGDVFLKKLAGVETTVRWVRVGTDPGLWLSGARHVAVFPQAPPRLAGDVLVWQHGELTLRLEGRRLTLLQAEKLARSLR
jgi:hypothetical protein